jgi:serine phosphatase RsbU (regulator of sigma subunit)
MTAGDALHRIVIIDDDEMVSEVLTMALEESYSVVSFRSAEDALRSGDLAAVDAVITDIHLPGMDGIELLDRVRAMAPAASVIMITGYNDIDLAVSAMKKGAFDFILKPFKNDQIIIAAEKAVEKRRLLQENLKLLEELRNKNLELEGLNREVQARNVAIENELEIARNLQRCLFPLALPEIRGVAFTQKCSPVEKISGDFFDIFVFDDNRFGLLFADVSGHGVPAALYAAMLKSAMDACIAGGVAPDQSVARMNRFMIDAQKKMSYNYATLFYGIFDSASGVLDYCNAGMPSPVRLRDGEMRLLEPNGPFIGIFADSKYGLDSIDFRSGDGFLFYTDGIFECVDAADELYGHDRLLDLVGELGGIDMGAAVASIYGRVEEYCGTRGFLDDVMLLGIRFNGSRP